MADDTSPRVRAIEALAEIFFEAAAPADDFESFERNALRLGHGCMREAVGLTLEALDDRLLAQRRRGLKAHDVRRRTLATEVSDVAFSIRRYRDELGCDVYPLADALGIPYGARVPPGASSFLVEAASQASYAKAARLLARNGSSVRATTVMECMRRAGRLCAEEDERAARSLYADGVLPDAEEVAEELCVEADGTYFSTQKCPPGTPKRMEVKAIVAYAGKEERGGKVRRRGCVRHAPVGSPGDIWSQGGAAIAERYDLAKVRRVHLGADGERWCRGAERYFPSSQTTFHLDPFHVSRAVMACFSDAKAAWSVIAALGGGDKAGAIALLRACGGFGVANAKRARRVIGYLEGNIDAIAVEGPSLGTMESENQHLYGARMDCWPCAWSPRGASGMARLISRRASGRAVPRMTRERSEGEARRERRARKEFAFHERRGSPPDPCYNPSGRDTFLRTRPTRGGWIPAKPTPSGRAWRYWIGESEPPSTLRRRNPPLICRISITLIALKHRQLRGKFWFHADRQPPHSIKSIAILPCLRQQFKHKANGKALSRSRCPIRRQDRRLDAPVSTIENRMLSHYRTA